MIGETVRFCGKFLVSPLLYMTLIVVPRARCFFWSLSGDENGCMVSTCRLYACPLPLHAATDLHLWGATALTQKSPRLNVRAFITSEITHSNDAQYSTKEQP